MKQEKNEKCQIGLPLKKKNQNFLKNYVLLNI